MVRRSVMVWTVVCLAGYSLLTFAADWTPIADKLSKSVVYIESKSGSCTGFVINTDVKKKDEPDSDYILTAAHCNAEDIYADQEKAKIVHLDTKKDLMVLQVDDTGRPALQLAKENPKIGDEAVSYGYGWGLERPMFRVAHIADDNTYIPEDGIGGPFIVTDAQFVPGMSGGPIVNTNGEVIMIVQRGGGAVGIGVGAEIIRQKTGKFWEKPKPVVSQFRFRPPNDPISVAIMTWHTDDMKRPREPSGCRSEVSDPARLSLVRALQ